MIGLLSLFKRKPQIVSEEIQQVADFIIAGKFELDTSAANTIANRLRTYKDISYYALGGYAYDTEVYFKYETVRPLNDAEQKVIYKAHRMDYKRREELERSKEYQAKKDLKAYLTEELNKESC